MPGYEWWRLRHHNSPQCWIHVENLRGTGRKDPLSPLVDIRVQRVSDVLMEAKCLNFRLSRTPVIGPMDDAEVNTEQNICSQRRRRSWEQEVKTFFSKNLATRHT
eukprot:1444606-Amphidinium_carterae.1